MPRGGANQKARGGGRYGNRTDIPGNAAALPITTVPGQQYGKGVQQADAQRAIPMGTPAPAEAAPVAAAPTQGPLPGEWGAFDRPSEYPNEPLTHGLASGPGAGPEALNLPATGDQTLSSRLDTLAMNTPEAGILASLMRGGQR